MRDVRARLAAACFAVALLTGGSLRSAAQDVVVAPTSPPVAGSAGRVLVLPGVQNVRFHLRAFVDKVERQLPGAAIDVRPWGTPLIGLYNVMAHERNVATAKVLADELTVWRRANPTAPLYVVGYSGGGGLAVLTVAALPDDVLVDRLVLVAPAISPSYPLAAEVLPNVRELVVNYASEKDLQVGWGTRTFGTIDRVRTDSAGAVGFELEHVKLVEWHWQTADKALGHRGNHLSYLDGAWQSAALLPALEPGIDAAALAARWQTAYSP